MVHEQLTDGPYCADDPLPSPKVPDAADNVTWPKHGCDAATGPAVTGDDKGDGVICSWKLAGGEVLELDAAYDATNPLPCTELSLENVMYMTPDDDVSIDGSEVPVSDASCGADELTPE